MATAWTVNDSGEVWTVHPQGGGALMAPADSALQVALGFDGIPWIVSTKRGSGAGNLVQYYSSTSGWQTLPATVGATQVAGSTNNFCWLVDENLAVWAVDINATLFRMSPDGFAIGVGVSSVGPAWAVGTAANANGNVIYWYNEGNGQWVELPAPAAGVQIAGQYDQSVWVVNGDGAIYNYQQNGTGKQMSPNGTAQRIGIGPDNMPWMISSTPAVAGGNQIQYFENGTWNTVPAPAAAAWVAGSL